jgi:hypothetical protein
MTSISERDQDIIASRIRLETLASIGERHGITRENVRQRWEKIATRADRRALKKATEERESARAASRVKPPKIKMARIHVLVPGAAELDPEKVVIELSGWDGKTAPPKTARGGDPFHLYLPAELKARVAELCAHHGVKVSDAVRYAASRITRNQK